MSSRENQYTVKWQQSWPGCPPAADELREVYPDHWMRFHSLPHSKRYPETEAENATVLGRYNTLLAELTNGDEVYLITSQWTNDPDEYEGKTDTYWMTIDENPEETDPEYRIFSHVFIEPKTWKPGIFDELFRSVANEESDGVIVAAKDFTWLFCPYDGGVDIFLPTAERNSYKSKHADWLSSEKSGL